jgi:acetyl esterase/lipase
MVFPHAHEGFLLDLPTRGETGGTRLGRHTLLLVVELLLVALLGGATVFAERAAAAGLAAGSLISARPIPGAPDHAAAYRILYRSTGMHGEPISVSGMVIVPAGPAPARGRPIVAWAHPTSGVTDICAPSKARDFFRTVQGLRLMLERGYIVTATDYQGLGTPGVHPYLVGISEGRSVIDSVRAARQVPNADAGSTFAVWGHSQGGHAALFAGLLAGGYAPDLKLVGVAAAAPATDLRTLMNDDLGTSGGNNITAMTLWSWARVYHAPIASAVKPEAMPVVDTLAGECIERWFDVFRRLKPTRALGKGFMRADDLASLEPWRDLLAINSPGPLPRSIPVFLAQGTTDKVVRPDVTLAYANRLCRHGNKVVFDSLPNVGHLFAARDSARSAIGWIADRFAGKPAQTDCGSGRLSAPALN